jgi:ComF family protein
MFSILTDPLLGLLYPQYCSVCGRLVERARDGAACAQCWEATAIFSGPGPACRKCGIPLSGVALAALSTCKQCDGHHYDSARAAGRYEKAIAASVLRLKASPNVPRTVRECLLAAFDTSSFPDAFTVVPVPLSKRRLLERGFNQAALLAQVVAGHSGMPLDEFSLVRKHDTPIHRAAMDRKARDASVRNVFDVARPAFIRGRNILLVDDLMTSGSTASYCAKALKKNGAGEVHVLTLARAV